MTLPRAPEGVKTTLPKIKGEQPFLDFPKSLNKPAPTDLRMSHILAYSSLFVS